jgi:hypothetical protein
METILGLLEFFALSLSLGVAIFSFLIETKETGSGAIKLMHTISLVSLIGAMIVHVALGSAGFNAYWLLVPLLLTSFIRFAHQEERSLIQYVAMSANSIVLVAIFYFFSQQDLLRFFFNTVSGIFLGGMVFEMVLGHWYLVVPKLSERFLKHGLYLLLPFMMIKIFMSGYFLFFTEGKRSLQNLDMFNSIIALMRVCEGYIIVGVLGFLSYKLVKMRSIQSATGIFYVMVFFVFVGELISKYMFEKYGLIL